MKRTLSIITLAAIAATGCGASDDASPTTDAAVSEATENSPIDAGDDTMITITGQLAYRERIALIPGGTATITLSDTSVQDVAPPTVAETTLELGDQQIPIPFELAADTSDLDERAMFTIRATITGPNGDLHWTTDTTNPIDITQSKIDLGMVMLVSASGTATDSDSETASPLVGEWNVIDIDGTEPLEEAPASLVFADDGTLSADTGCNSLSVSYGFDGDALTLDSEPAVTLMACDPDVTAQETAILVILGSVRTGGSTFDIADNTLTITAADGASLTAQR